MRIGQFSDSFLPIVDGVGRVVVSYAQNMAAQGQQVTAFAPSDDMGDTSGYPFDIVTYSTIPMPGKMPYRVGIPQLDIRFEKEMHTTPLDIVHVHSPFMLGRSGLEYSRRHSAPLIGSFHSKYYDDFSMVLKSDVLAKTGVKYVVDFYERCDEVWAVSRATADTLHSYGYGGEVVVMPNGTDLRTLDASVLPQLRAAYGIGEDEPVLLFVGQMNWKKNIRRVLEACRLLRDQGTAFRLVLAGQGPHRDEIEAEGAALGLAEHMVFTGHVADTRTLDGLYALASLFVFPSLYDNAPLVLREASAMGTPSVLVAGSNAAEDVTDGVNGLLCQDDAASLAEAITRGLSDAALLAAMGDAARRTIAVAWTDIVRQCITRYEHLLEGKGRS